MGGYISKLFYHDEHDKTHEFNASSLILENRDTCTPQPQKRKSLIDPRSATLGITRTPIEVLNTPQKEASNVISSVPKYLKRKPYLETNFDVTPPSRTLEKSLDPRSPSVDVPRTPITVETFPDNETPKHSVSQQCNKTNLMSEMHKKLLGLDPRSPAIDFDRTPILKPKSLEKETICSQENLTTITHEIKVRLSYSETKNSSDIIEITALPDIATNLNNSQNSANQVPGTSHSSNSNTPLNNSIVTVLSNRNEASPDSSLTSSSSSSDCPLEIEKIEHKRENFEEKLIADSDKIIDNVLNIAMKDFENKINEAENKIKIWRDNLSPETEEDSEYDSESESEDHSENRSPNNDFVIEYDDEINVVGTIKKTEYIRRKSILIEKKKSKHFKKEVETKKHVSPVMKQINEAKKTELLKNRTPLRNRLNSNSQQQGTDLKSPPLRRKVLLSSTKFQENTPPRTKKSGLKSKFNNTQWDGDSTIII